jgi:hypothetical protein
MLDSSERPQCTSCDRRPSTRECGMCASALCKACTQFLDAETFSFYAKIPLDLSHAAYCDSCFASIVQPAREELSDDLRRAQDIVVFTVNQRRHLTMTVSKERLEVKNCKDRNEAFLRLAYFAVKSGRNSLVQVDVYSTKVRDGAYQSSLWHGSGYAADVDLGKLERRSES